MVTNSSKLFDSTYQWHIYCIYSWQHLQIFVKLWIFFLVDIFKAYSTVNENVCCYHVLDISLILISCARNFLLCSPFLGLLRNCFPQQGHQKLSQLRNISHTLHLFCPLAYLGWFAAVFALYLWQIPLHTILDPRHYYLLIFNGSYNLCL